MTPNSKPAQFILSAIGDHVAVSCDQSGLLFSGPGRLDRRELWPDDTRQTSAGVRVAIELEQLLELGLAEAVVNEVRIPFENFADVEAFDIDITARWTTPCPFLLKIDRFSDIGTPTFAYRYEFLRAGAPVYLDRLGYYIRRAGKEVTYRLDSQTYALVNEMDQFNTAGAEAKAPRNAWLSFAKVKNCAREVGATLDATLQNNDVVVPSSLSLSMVGDDQGRLTFLPRCPEVGDGTFEHAFDRNATAEPFYSVPGSGGKRLRIILNDNQQEVLRRMKAVRKVEGKRRDELICDPGQIFEEVAQYVQWAYSDRVVGIGDFKFVPMPRVVQTDGGMAGLWKPGDSPERFTPTDAPGQPTEQTGPHATDGSKPSSPGSPGPPADGDGVGSASEPDADLASRSKTKQYLLIKTNEDALEQNSMTTPDGGATTAPKPMERPGSLLDQVELQPHQSEGVRWLQACADVQGRTGVLLADDMGLGKTLQILTFLSWCIETGRFPDLAREAPPWRPVLIVVPLNTKISHAVKALKPDFHIACTGTPVENGLLDLWNVYDAIQPGLLSSAKDFTNRYIQRVSGEERQHALDDLKTRLLFQKPNAFLLRRSKSEVATLPARHFHRPECAMSPDEINRHQDLITALRATRNRMTHLAVLQRLAQLYQHPALFRGDAEDLGTDQLTAESPKLRLVCEELHRIRAIGQKAIVFARHRVMQSILARTFEAEFRIPVRIINGLTKSTAAVSSNSLKRSATLDEFRSAKGFRVIVLSPFVAGIGLTITEANHVFHYGRWWNPAVEAQATDRAYRIGQTRDVHVYLPISRDTTGVIPTSFDERLDRLMMNKAKLAEDFLRPLESEDALAQQLSDELVSEGSIESPHVPRTSAASADRAAYAACVLERSGYLTALPSTSYTNGVDLLASGDTYLALRCAELPEERDEAREAVHRLKAAAAAYSDSFGVRVIPAIWDLGEASHQLAGMLDRDVQRLSEICPRADELTPTVADVQVRGAIRVDSTSEAFRILRTAS